MKKPILLIDNPKRSQNNCGKFVVPYEQSKDLDYGEKYMILIFPLEDAEYKYNRLKAAIVGGLKVQIEGEK